MVQLAEAYFNGKKVKPVWGRGKFSPNEENKEYLKTKAEKMRHDISFD